MTVLSQLINKNATAIKNPVLLKKEYQKSISLIKIAASHGQTIKKDIILLLKQHGLGGTAKNVDTVLTLQQVIEHARANRLLEKINSRITEQLKFLPKKLENHATKIVIRPVKQRLENLRRSTLIALSEHCFLSGAPGGTTHQVTYAEKSSDVGYTVSLGRNYHVYRGRFKGWPANVDNHQICVPKHWRTRVQNRKLAVLGGLLTLDAAPMQGSSDIELYAAAWAVQERGYCVKTVRGFIARFEGQHFHADTVEAAISGVMKKSRNATRSAETLLAMALAVDEFVSKYATVNISVSLSDARNSGSCEYGIRSWCESVGIDIARGSVPMAELLAGFKLHPLNEVRAAVLCAVRRRRSNSQKKAKKSPYTNQPMPALSTETT